MDAGRLIESNIRAHTVDGYTAQHMVAAAHETTIRALVTRINEFEGVSSTPQPGCEFAVMSLGEADVLVEYEYTAECAPIYDADHPGVGPGHDASVSIIGALINGVWCDAQDVIPAGTLQRWEEKLVEQCTEAA